MPASIDPDKITDIIIDCAARLILPRFRDLSEDQIQSKSSPSDLVTVADIETEKELKRLIEGEYTDAILIGEESVSRGDASVDILRDQDGLTFVADPVDGTNNFVHGNETFCVMLACVYKNEVIYGWIYDVIQERMLLAGKRAGATINGEKIVVSTEDNLSKAQGYANPIFFPKKIRGEISILRDSVDKLTSLHCSGHEYLRLATGEMDFSISTRTKPWDHLAGTLAVNEAGGVTQTWDGGVYRPDDYRANIIVANNQEIVESLKTAFINKLYEEKAS